VIRVQQLLFEVEGSYYGHPYFVTGNALFNAIARRADAATRRSLHVSTGVFVPGEYGTYPDRHSQSGRAGKMGMSLQPVEAYEDLFLFRDAAHRWLKESRPRDAHNTHDVESHGGRLAFASSKRFGRPAEMRANKRTMSWFVHCYVHADEEGVVPLDADVVDGVRVGGARNYGLGELSLADSQVVDVGALDFSAVNDASTHRIELLSPYVLQSECPGADRQSVPWWWDNDENLRRRDTRFVDGVDVYDVATVDHGQVVGYAGDDPVSTAVNGVLRVGTHSRFGFGEFRVRSASSDRVPARAKAGAVRADGGDV